MRLRRILVLVVAALLTVVAAYLVVGHRLASGPVLFRLGEQHGVHAGDLPVAALWGVGIAVCAMLWRVPADRR